MKLKSSASANFLFPEASIADILLQIEDSGFDAVEFQFLKPQDAAQISGMLENFTLEVALINFGLGDFIHGGAGLSGVPGRTDQFREALDRAVQDAQILGASIAHIGPCRVPEGVNRDRCIEQLIENIYRALELFSSGSTQLSLEALNRTEFADILIGSPDEAMEVIDRVGDDRLVLQYDIYHAARDGRDVLQDISTYIDSIGHVQFADCPGRHEPGTGAVDFAACFSCLKSLEYRGFIGAEYMPSIDFHHSLAWRTLL